MNNGLVVIVLASIATAAAAQGVVEADADIDRMPSHTVIPAYPEKARRARVEGEVEVCFLVNREGRTSRIAVRRSSNRVFERPSIEAVRASTYKPLSPGQKPSGIKTCRTFRFVLSPVAIDDLID